VIEDLPIKKIEEAKPETTIARETLFGKEIYLSDLKLLDYRAYRSRPKIATKQMILTGTPANVGDNTPTETTTEWKDVDVPYIDYLEKTMDLFAKGQNKKALARFEVILDTYADDLNANFYAGLCYYNLNDFDLAVTAFSKCTDSKYTNFLEEAEWYIAKSHLAKGSTTLAIDLFTKIAKENGYYSAQAKKVLSSL
jgi:tetratricopeptide (TPR) repeat protein